MRTASEILHDVINLTMGEKHEEALQVIKNWGCEVVNEMKTGHYMEFVEGMKKQIQED